MENLNLSKKEIESLEIFSFKVDMEGFAYALGNYGPSENVFNPVYKLPTLDAVKWLSKLREKYNIEEN